MASRSVTWKATLACGSKTKNSSETRTRIVDGTGAARTGTDAVDRQPNRSRPVRSPARPGSLDHERLRRRPRRHRFARGQRFHRVPDPERAARLQVDLLFRGAMSVQIQLDRVFPRFDMEALHEAVEVVHDAGVVAVDEDFSFTGRDLQPEG